MITIDITETPSTTMGTWKIIGSLPESVQPNDAYAGLIVRVTDGVTTVSDTITDDVYVSARGFKKAMEALSTKFGVQVEVARDHGVKHGGSVVGIYGAPALSEADADDLVEEINQAQLMDLFNRARSLGYTEESAARVADCQVNYSNSRYVCPIHPGHSVDYRPCEACEVMTVSTTEGYTLAGWNATLAERAAENVRILAEELQYEADREAAAYPLVCEDGVLMVERTSGWTSCRPKFGAKRKPSLRGRRGWK